MKKYILLALCLFFGSVSIASAAYQQQGFNQFKENDDGSITFWCEKSCVVLLGDRDGKDLVKVEWGTRQWQGQWGYGYLVGQQVYAATVVPANSYERSFADDPIYSQLPKGSNQVVFLVTGPLKADNVQITMEGRGGSAQLGWLRKRFRNIETLAPYTINLHYGPFVGGWSWPLFSLVIALIALVVAYIIRKKMTLSEVMFTCMGALMAMMIVGGVRLLIDDMKIIQRGHQEFSAVQRGDKKFFELGDYITVTEKVRNQLDLDNVDARRGKECKIYTRSHMSWPFDAHRASVYLRPCTPVQTGSEADYGLYYNVMPTFETGINLLSGANFYLYNFRP